MWKRRVGVDMGIALIFVVSRNEIVWKLVVVLWSFCGGHGDVSLAIGVAQVQVVATIS